MNTLQKAALFSGALMILFLTSIIFAVSNISLCIPFEGIDHNSKNERFSGHLGWCK